jgi:hypothetical protein
LSVNLYSREDLNRKTRQILYSVWFRKVAGIAEIANPWDQEMLYGLLYHL